ncbi:RNA-directed DNA polymerase, eukaryota, reverse transcriptase zinc-binding domain protein, partial [Tanacetum coccineum]
NKHCRVNERWVVLNGVWGGNYEWCSSPRGRTLDEVSELSRLIGNLVLSLEQQDGWRWKLNPNGKFAVNNLSKLIDIAILGSNVMSYKLDWNQIVLRKVNICIWKAVNDRLPTRANLLLRGLAVSSSLCPLYKVGDLMTRIKSWEEIINKLYRRLSKWKLKTLSIGGRLTLLKSVLGSMPRYYMLVFKAPAQTIHGEDGINLLGFIKKKVGVGENTSFWEEPWKGDVPFKLMYPRVYALELFKNILVASKLSHSNVGFSLRRSPRGEAELELFMALLSNMESFILPSMQDRWSWCLSGSGEFSVASIRYFIDDHTLV